MRSSAATAATGTIAWIESTKPALVPCRATLRRAANGTARFVSRVSTVRGLIQLIIGIGKIHGKASVDRPKFFGKKRWVRRA